MKRIALILASCLMAVLGFWRLRRYLLAWIMRLSRPRYRFAVERDIRIASHDGVSLATDHYAPRSSEPLPTVLLRSPYGRNTASSIFGAYLEFVARLFAERGYHVLVQDTRGRFGSGGVFDPPFNETEDGLATVEWLKRQPWHNGTIGLWGPSYLGIVQWALAPHAPQVKAMMPTVTGADLQQVLFPDGAFDLSLAMRWIAILEVLEEQKHHPYPANLRILRQVERAIAPAFEHLPIATAEQIALGKRIPYYANWMAHINPEDSLWVGLRERVKLTSRGTPVHLIGGWYDFFLRPLLRDYAELKAGGQKPYLTIGNFHHFNGMITPLAIREGIAWFDTHLKGKAYKRIDPVRIFVMGENRWRSLPDFPPPARETMLYLQSGRSLRTELPEPEAAPDCYPYDPALPTPILGGNQFSPWAGPKDNRELEKRSDVLTFTSSPLQSPVEIIGAHIPLTLYVSSTVPYTDFFARLCDIHPSGKSINICDGFYRVTPSKVTRAADGTMCITIDLWATAHQFKRGHRIGLLISSGAHPRWARNPGVEDPNLIGTQMQACQQTIYHDREHPSALHLPVTDGVL